MKRILIIGAGVAVAGVIAFVIWYVVSGRQQTAETASETQEGTVSSSLPIALEPPAPDADSFLIAGKRGSVRVRNFIKDADAYGSTYVLVDSPRYSILYQRELQQFLVSLKAESREDVGLLLEASAASLAETLGISRSETCNLRTDVGVPDSYASAFSDARYIDLALPGCAQSAAPTL